MEPSIGTILDALFYGQGLMRRSIILFSGIVVKHTGPKKYSTSFGQHRNVISVKIGTTTLFDIIQIQIHRQYSWPLLSKKLQTVVKTKC
jgi:hypothetical protein